MRKLLASIIARAIRNNETVRNAIREVLVEDMRRVTASRWESVNSATHSVLSSREGARQVVGHVANAVEQENARKG